MSNLFGPHLMSSEPPPILAGGSFHSLLGRRKPEAELFSSVPELTACGRYRSIYWEFLILLMMWPKSGKEREVSAMCGLGSSEVTMAIDICQEGYQLSV